MKRIYFVDAGTRKLENLSSFGGNKIFGVNLLEISRLDDGNWEKVVKTVEEYEAMEKHVGPAVIVPGKLHGPLRHRFPKGLVKFLLVANTKDERDSWLRELRHRVAPWDFLRQNIREAGTKSYSKDRLTKEIQSLFLAYDVGVDPPKTKSKGTNELQSDLPDGAKIVSSNESDSDLNDSLLGQSTAIIACDNIATDPVKSNDSISKQPVLAPIPTKRRSVLKGMNAIDDLAASTDGKTAVDFSKKHRADKFQEQLEHGDMAEKFNTHVMGLVGAGATITKLVDNAKNVTEAAGGDAVTKIAEQPNQVAEVAGKVGDVAKVVGGVSSLFHLVGLCAKVVAKMADEKEGREVLPLVLRRIMYFLGHVLDSAVAVLTKDPPKGEGFELEKLLADHTFLGLKTMLGIMSQIEDQDMRPGFVRFLKSSVLKDVDDAVKKLETNVIKIVRTRLITEMDKRSSFEVRDVPIPPPLGETFNERAEELDQLNNMLSTYGSAVITSDAGFGKTQLMIKVAKEFLGNNQNVASNPEGIASNSTGVVVEQDRIPEEPEGGEAEEPNGTVEKALRIAVWVKANGNASEVIRALADVTETLIGKKVGDADREKHSTVLDKLELALEQRKEEWLLCLDGAENAEIDVAVNGILGRVCRIADRKTGRVLITTRE